MSATKTHRHKADPAKSRTVGYSSPIPGATYNPRAHGGVCHVDVCSCGAERRTNSTGFGRDERGPWEQE